MRRVSFLLLGCLLLAGCGGGGGNNDNDATANAKQFPLVFSISPAQGKLAGGDTVTITGRYFTKRARSAVVVSLFGPDIPATVVNDTTITFVTPSGVPLLSQNVTEPQVRVHVIADGMLSSGLTGSDDPLFQYSQ